MSKPSEKELTASEKSARYKKGLAELKRLGFKKVKPPKDWARVWIPIPKEDEK